jgi:colanic acid/amylovoran biosynthesis glycosyltransferase
LRIVYVTTNLPYGTDEAFIVPEIRQWLRSGHEILVVPRSPGGPILHGKELLKYSRCEGLCSARVLKAAAFAPPERVLKTRGIARQSRSAPIAMKNLAVIPKALWLARAAQDWHADHIHCHWAATTATMAMLASSMTGIPWSFTAHRWDIVENNLLAVKARSASLVRFISDDGLKMARERGVEYGDHVQVLRMGVTIPARIARAPRGRRVVLCPARLVEVKGHRYLLEAWRQVCAAGADAELWLAGGGGLRPRLEEMAATLALRDSVRFLGAIPHDDLLKMYENGTISAVVLASIDLGNGHHEGVPVALIEAMSYGVPVVATSTGGTGELLGSGSGVLVEPEQPRAMASALLSLLRDPAFAMQIGDNGRRRVVESYDIVKIVAGMAEIFTRAGDRRATLNYS